MTIDDIIAALAEKYATALKTKIDARVAEMADDDKSHFLIYRALGVAKAEGNAIDVYQNKGRFLYRQAGSFLEKATQACFAHKFPASGSKRIANTVGVRPKTFEIDCLNGSKAIEIKWRDATTDGDHITKEHTRIKVISDAGYVPVRVMFYYPNRAQATKIQATLKTLYKGVGGEYYAGDDAWEYVKSETNVDLFAIVNAIADERAPLDA